MFNLATMVKKCVVEQTPLERMIEQERQLNPILMDESIEEYNKPVNKFKRYFEIEQSRKIIQRLMIHDEIDDSSILKKEDELNWKRALKRGLRYYGGASIATADCLLFQGDLQALLLLGAASAYFQIKMLYAGFEHCCKSDIIDDDKFARRNDAPPQEGVGFNLQ